MADSQASQALSKRISETALMPPPPPPKRIKRPTKVLDEDVYTDTLSHIIARDFFPGLMETQAQQEYLEAIESQNKDWIRDAGRKLHQAMTPGPGGRGRRGTSMAPTPRRTGATQTPRCTKDTPRGWGGETPRQPPAETPTSSAGDDRPKQPQVDHTLSLGAFQSKYTSEDNESFNALLDRQNIKRAEKYAFMHNGNKLPSARQIEEHKQRQQLLQQSNDSSSALVPLRPSQNLDDRSAKIETFANRQGPKNTLMFAPDGIEDTHITTFQVANDRSLAPPRSVSYAATRLPTTDPSVTVPPSPSMSAIDAAIAGNPRPSNSTTEADYTGAETPRVAGYAFVDAEPTPEELGIPVSDEEAERQEQEAMMALMPSVASSEDAKNPFKFQDASKREELHHRIVDKQNSQRRKIGGAGGGAEGSRLAALKGVTGTPGTTGRTPTPSFKSSPFVGGRAGGGGGMMGAGTTKKKTVGGNLTPAARMLAASIGKTPRRAEGSLFGNRDEKGKGRAWTPTPRIKRA